MSDNSPPALSVVSPVFNEQETLPEFYQRVDGVLQSLGIDYEVVLVNDGSSDGTAAELHRIRKANPRWRYVTFSRNFGHQAAISAGLQFAEGETVVIMDSDLQDPPELIEQFIEKHREGYDVVFAVRKKRKENVFKRFAYATFYRLLKWIAVIDIPLDSGDFCLMDRAVVDVLKSLPERARFVRGLRSWAGFRQVGVEYDRPSRYAGDAKYTLRKLVGLALDGLISFSPAPLRLASSLGVLFCGLAILLTGLLCVWWAWGGELLGMRPGDSVGWTSLASGMLLLSGVQMLLLGIMGEYLSRVFDEVKGRPQFVVSRAEGIEWPRRPRHSESASLAHSLDVEEAARARPR